MKVKNVATVQNQHVYHFEDVLIRALTAVKRYQDHATLIKNAFN